MLVDLPDKCYADFKYHEPTRGQLWNYFWTLDAEGHLGAIQMQLDILTGDVLSTQYLEVDSDVNFLDSSLFKLMYVKKDETTWSIDYNLYQDTAIDMKKEKVLTNVSALTVSDYNYAALIKSQYLMTCIGTI